MLPGIRLLMVMMLLAQCLSSSTFGAAGAESLAKGNDPGGGTRTAKERLGGKASDEQRVDNCKVPPDLRGAKPRPDCNDK
jgi:hypothetical protein